MELLTACPLCKNTDFNEFLTSQDYFLTKESFTIVQCKHCGLKFLNPRPEEKAISKYYQSAGYISHDNTSAGLLNFLYTKARNYTLRNKLLLIKKYKKEGTILDIGCGTGEFISYCKQSGWDVKGIEPNAKAREYAILNNKVEVLDESGLASFNRTSFDIITLWHVLEHVYRLDERMTEISQLLKDNGIVIIAVPNSNSWDAKKYQSYWAAYDLPRHIYHFSQKTIMQLASNFGFEVEEIVPMKLDAFYISLLSEKYLTGHSNYFSSLFNGFKSNNFARKNKKEYSSLIFVLKAKKTKIKPSGGF